MIRIEWTVPYWEWLVFEVAATVALVLSIWNTWLLRQMEKEAEE